jgi:hypothetical protein
MCFYSHIESGKELIEGDEIALAVFLEIVEFAVSIKVKALVNIGVGLVGYVVEMPIQLTVRVLEDMVAVNDISFSIKESKVTFF